MHPVNRLVFTICFIAMTTLANAESRKNRLHMEMSQLAMAATQYKTEYGVFPTGKSIEVIRALTGTNLRKIIFIDWAGRSSDANGRFLDQWNSPFLILFPDTETVEIRSAGPDKRFDTSDDIHFRKGREGIDHNAQ